MKTLDFCQEKIESSCTVKRHRLCAIAFSKSGHIIASATNRIHSDGFVSNFSIHAEEFLINKLRKVKAKERFGKIRVLVVRLAKGKGWAMAKPCKNCENILRSYGVQEVSYTSEDGSIKILY